MGRRNAIRLEMAGVNILGEGEEAKAPKEKSTDAVQLTGSEKRALTMLRKKIEAGKEGPVYATELEINTAAKAKVKVPSWLVPPQE